MRLSFKKRIIFILGWLGMSLKQHLMPSEHYTMTAIKSCTLFIIYHIFSGYVGITRILHILIVDIHMNIQTKKFIYLTK